MEVIYKLLINSLYGITGAEFYEDGIACKHVRDSVCVIGQCCLVDLIQRLEQHGCVCINNNTDGVGFTTDSANNSYKDVKSEWEKDWNMGLSEDIYTHFYSKDVNNYISVEPDGGMKLKGGFVGKAKMVGSNKFALTSTDECVVDKCVVDYITTKQGLPQDLMSNFNTNISKLEQLVLHKTSLQQEKLTLQPKGKLLKDLTPTTKKLVQGLNKDIKELTGSITTLKSQLISRPKELDVEIDNIKQEMIDLFKQYGVQPFCKTISKSTYDDMVYVEGDFVQDLGKVTRVFYGTDGGQVYKRNLISGTYKNTKPAGTSDNNVVLTDDITPELIDPSEVDFEFYATKVMSKVLQYILPKDTKKYYSKWVS